jgi:hypothetical protein
LFSGIEAIVYKHPYKKFYFSMLEEAYEEVKNKKRYGGVSINLMDYGLCVGTISTYSPDGMERNKLQVQFRYNYNVHQKEPKNIKRSSDHKKILEFATMFRPLDITSSIVPCMFFGCVLEDIEGVTKLQDGYKSLRRVMEPFYYSALETTKIIRELIDGTSSIQTDKFKHEFEAAWSKSMETREAHARLTDRIAVVIPTPYGEYLLCRFQSKDKGKNEDLDSFNHSAVVYPDKASLPEDVSGKMVVLEIANTSDESSIVVDGVGMFHKAINKMVIIGEDLYGIDPGAESQTPSSESS